MKTLLRALQLSIMIGFCVITFCTPVFALNPGDIFTVAGNGGFGGDNGPATSASLSGPDGVIMDSSGNLYFADSNNHRIRKVDAATGIITTVAGNGTKGFSGDSGPATSAMLNSPSGVALDGNGNLYIADVNNYRIRRVDAATGVITTAAGSSYGFSGDSGLATSARLSFPYGVTLDSSGNLYIADRYNHRIRKVAAATGIITTVAGNGTGGFSGDGGLATSAGLYYPTGIAVDSSGNLYVADSSNIRIRKVDAATGIITTVAGNGAAGSVGYSGDGGLATSVSLITPYAVAIDSSGNLYVADLNSHRVRKVAAATGIITTVVGNGTLSGDGVLAASASMNSPRGVTLDSSGNLYVAEGGNSRIRKVAAATGIITTAAGNGNFGGDGDAATAASLYSPSAAAVDGSGNLYIVDKSNHRIRKVAAGTGIITTVAGNGTAAFSGDGGLATLASLNEPSGVAVDSSGNLYIADFYNSRIRKVNTATGIITTVAGSGTFGFGGDGGPATSASLSYLYDVALDGSGNLYIVDYSNQRIRKVDAVTGIITTVAGNGTAGYSGDGGPATSASLNWPWRVALDSSGHLYIADTYNHRIRKVDAATGVITTVAGTGTAAFGGEGGLATSASLNYPSGVALDSNGNLYIADRNNSRIRKVAAGTGVITAVVGNGTATFSGDNGPATSAGLNDVYGVALDSSGNLYIADRGNNRIRKVIKPTHTTAAIGYSPAGPYTPGAAVTITAVFNDQIADATPPQIALSGANTLSATPMTKVDYRTYNYTYTVQEGRGTVNITIPGGSDSNGITLAAIPSSGGSFDVIGNPTIGASAVGNGTITCTPTTVALGETSSCTVTATALWTRIASVSGCGIGYTGTGNGDTSQTLTTPAINLSCIVTATFAPNSYTVAFNSNGGSSVASQTVNYNARATIPATPTKSGYVFSGWHSDAGLTTAFNFATPITTDTTLYAKWAVSYTVSFTSNGGSSVASQTVADNTTAAEPTTPVKTSHTFNGWYSDSGLTTAFAFTTPITADTSLYAKWTLTAHNPGDIFTVAGNGGFGGDNGPATSASLRPAGVALDSSGNLYIADSGNNRIRKIDAATGIITTVAGNGAAGFSGDDDPASSAILNNPSDVALDNSGNLYIADYGNNRIRKMDAVTGVIATVAGDGIASFSGDGGLATSASLKSPYGVTVDSNGNLYIADSGNSRIRKVDAATGVITTVAGTGTAAFSGDNGPAISASLKGPTNVSLDSSGNLYIADCSNHRIRKVDAISGIITTVAGNGTDAFSVDGGEATSTSLAYPLGLTLDTSGNLYIVDLLNSRIRKVDAATGIISTVVGDGYWRFSGDNGPAISASLSSPYGVALDSSGNLFIADYGNQRIRKVDAATGVITTVAGRGNFGGDGGPAIEASLYGAQGVSVDASSNLYIADSGNNLIRKVDAVTGVITTVAGTGTAAFSGDGGLATSASLSYTSGVALDSSGNLYIADRYNHRIRKVAAATGIITTVAGNGTGGFSGDGGPATSASLNWPWRVALDSSGNLYIADSNNHRIRKVDAISGIITTVAGNGTGSFGGDGGPATSASLYLPYGVALDSSGNLYVADRYNNRIRKVAAATGIITTVAGNGAAGFSGDNGPATAAGLSYTQGVSVDSAGNLYIADSGNQRIRKVDAASGIITTVAGTGTFGFGGDGGPATSANLYSPAGLALDSDGNLYIADVNNNRIRKVILQLAGPASAPVISGPAGQSAAEGASQALALGSFSDTDGGPWTVTVNWGDGSGNTVFSAGSAGSLGSQSHTYADSGFYSVTVQVQDSALLTGSATFSVSVSNVAPSVNAGVSQIAFKGATVSLAPATFTDSGPADTHTATINWGDGTAIQAGTVSEAGGSGTVAGSHIYNNTGTYSVTVTVCDDDGGCGSGFLTVTVNSPPPVLTTPATANIGANIATLSLKSDSTGTGYFTVLTGSGTACGSGTQVKNGLDSTGAAAFRRGSLALSVDTAGSYTVRNLTQSTVYTVCFTADDGTNLQATPATVDFTTTAAINPTTSAWTTVGSAGFSADSAFRSSLSFAPDGTPYVAYLDQANGGKTTAKKYDGTAWIDVGSAGFSAGVADYTSFSFAPDGTPYVAYMAYANGTIKKYDGASWVDVGSAGVFSVSYAYHNSLSFAPDGTPYVAYSDLGASWKATVKKYDGTAWVDAGSAGFSAGVAAYTSLSFAPDGTPYVAYSDGGNGGKATVKKYDGVAWVDVGSAGFSPYQADFTSLAFAPDGAPYVAYLDHGHGYKATVKKYDGAAWVDVGSAGFSAGEADYTSLSFAPDGTPYVAYVDCGNGYKATVKKYDGAGWVDVGSAGLSASNYTSLSFAPDGTPYVAYMDYGNGNKATVMKLVPAYTVTYDGNGASGGSAPIDSGKYVQGATVTAAANSGGLARSGYTFAGWNTATDGTGIDYAATGSATFTMGAANTTLYAQWTINSYTVTASAATPGGSISPSGDVTINHNATKSFILAADPGYSFTGITGTCPAGSGDATAYTTGAILADCTVVANFKRTQKIIFDNPGPQMMGSTPTLAATATSGLAPTFKTLTTDICTITPDGVLTPVAVGTCTIDADQEGDATYLAAPRVTQSFLITDRYYAASDGLTSGSCTGGWAKPCELQYALKQAVAGELWVKAGVYKPTDKYRDVSFQLKNNLAIYGGFSGTENSRAARLSGPANETILSGDIGIAGDAADNSYHVVTASGVDATAILDGFTITGGNADGGGISDLGGGIFISDGSPVLANLAIHGNSAVYGGGIFTEGSVLVTNVTNVTFSANSASEEGGGICNLGNIGLVLTNVTLSGNTANSAGGGIRNSKGGPLTMTNGILWGNTAPTGSQIDNSGSKFAATENVTHSIIQDGCPAGFICADEVVTADAKLGDFGYHGGSTRTIPLLAGSPAIDAGTCTGAPTTDQRGMARNGACDIGAYERGISASLAATAGTPQSTAIETAFAIPLTARVTDTLGGALDSITVSFAGPGSGADIASGGTATSDSSGLAAFSVTANGSAGSYTVTATAGSPSVNFSLTNGQGSQSITFGAAPTVVVDGTGTVTATGGASGNAVTFNSQTAGVCTVIGATVTGVTVGDCVIAANQAGNANYSAASQVTQTFAIGKGIATVTLGNLNQTYDGAAKAAIATTNPAGLTVTFTYDGSPTPPTNAGNYAVVATINDANYQGSASGTLVIILPTYTVTFDLAGGTRTGGGDLSQTIIHGQAATAPTVTAPTGKTFSSWSTTFSNITANTSVTAQYSDSTYTITPSSSIGGSISPTGSVAVNHAASQAFTLAADPGYTFTGMTGTCPAGSGDATSYTTGAITSDCTVVANFADLTAPVISNTAPAQDSFINTGSVGYTLSEAVVSGNITFTQTGGVDDPSSPRVYTLTLPDMTAGSHTISEIPLQSGSSYTMSFAAADAAGNTAIPVIVTNVTYDATAPVVTIDTPAPGVLTNSVAVIYSLSKQLGTATITATRTGGTADGASYSYSLLAAELASGSHTVDTGFTLVNGATYTFTISDIIDLAGNAAVDVSVAGITFDDTSLPVELTAPATASTLTTTQVDISLGEEAQTASITFTRTGGSEDAAAPHTYNFTGIDLLAGSRTINTALPLVNGAIYSVSLAATDLAGNPATTATVTNVTYIDRYTLTVEKTGTGTGTVTAPADLSSGISCGTSCSEIYAPETTVTLTATADPDSHVSSWSGCHSTSGDLCTIAVNSDKTVSASFAINSYTVTFDLAGGTRTGGGDLSQMITHGQAATAPTITAPVGKTVSGWSTTFTSITATTTVTAQYVDSVSSPGAPIVTGDAFTNSKRPTWSWTTGGNGNGTFRYHQDSDDFTASYTTTTDLSVTALTDLADGSNTLYVQERDDAGNWSMSGSFTTVVDTTNPILIVSTLDNQTTNNATLNVSGTVNELAAVTINDNPTTVTDGIFSYPFALVSGSNTITIVVTDTVGNSTTTIRTVIFDVDAPTLTIATPADNSATAAPQTTITGSCGDAASVTVKVNNNTQQVANITLGSYSLTVNLSEGQNTLTVTATDAVGNNSSMARTITYDSTAPTLAITSPIADITVHSMPYTISGIVEDTLTEVSLTMTVNGQAVAPTINGADFTYQLDAPQVGVYQVVVTAKDQLENTATVMRNVIYEPYGDINSDGVTTSADALRALLMAVGKLTINLKADVAPLVNGVPAPDGKVTAADALLILRKSVGLW